MQVSPISTHQTYLQKNAILKLDAPEAENFNTNVGKNEWTAKRILAFVGLSGLAIWGAVSFVSKLRADTDTNFVIDSPESAFTGYFYS